MLEPATPHHFCSLALRTFYIVMMGGRWSTTEERDSQEEEDEDESYERLHQLRRHLFPLCDDEDVLRVAIKDKVSYSFLLRLRRKSVSLMLVCICAKNKTQIHIHSFKLIFSPSSYFPLFSLQTPSLVYEEDNGFRLYIGSAFHAQDLPGLHELGVSRIVNMAAGSLMTSQELYGESITILLICAEDMESYDLSQHFDEVTDFIDKGKEEGAGVFVHCMAGVSRSVTVSVAFLMK